MTKSIIRIAVLTAIFAIAFIGCIDPLNPLGGGGDNNKLEGSVSISGTAQVSQTLTANTNNLRGSGAISFQWFRGGGTVAVGHNSSTYVVQAGDVGHTITVNVTRSDNTGHVTGGPTAAVIDLPLLTINRNPWAGGTVSPASESKVNPGTSINIRATPESGYRFVNWTVESGTATFGNRDSASTTVTLSADATIRANFQQIFTLIVNREPTAGGTVSPTSQSGIVSGTRVDITATSASGYRFVNWTVVSGTATFSNANSAFTTVTLSSNATIRANFGQLVTLTVNREPTAGGTVSPTSQSSVALGTPANISATPANGYRFVNWTVVSGTATFGNANNASTTVTLSTNAVIRANFQINTLTVNVNPWNGGTVSPTSQTGFAFGTPINITATPASGYRFVNWTVVSGTATFGDGNSASTTVTLSASANATIRANFEQLRTLTVSANPTIGGTVLPTSQSNIISETPVDIMATPANGYRFVNWTVISGTATFGNANNASTTVTLSANATIRANFEQYLFRLTADANPTVGGAVSPTSQAGIASGTPINITATPESDYRFVNWTVISGTAVFGNANDASTTVTLSANATIRANFQTFTLTVNANPTVGGTVSPAGQVNVNPETPVVNITAEPASNYRFVNWTVVSGTATFGNANDASTTVTLSANATIRANFQVEVIDGGILTYGSQDYRTVIIGGRRWMAENLNFAGSDGNVGVCYGNNASNCNIYGRLYTWAEAMNLPALCNSSLCANQVQSNQQGICPVGWRVPSDADWTTLTNFVGSPAGTKLKSRTGWNNNGNGTDDFGFSALPGGGRWPDGSFRNVGSFGNWWSATEDNASGARRRDMGSGYTDVNSYWDDKSRSFSLRCIMND